MRAAHIIFATWVLSVHGTPIQIEKHHENRANTGHSGLQEGQQVQSPCPDLIDPHTATTALYFYRGITPEQRRSTQFINDNWGLVTCCNSQLRDTCPPPPDPQPVFSPCAGLKSDTGKTLFFFYQNPYTTDQIASDYIIIYALTNKKCGSWNEGDGAPISLSPATYMDLQAGNVQSPGILPLSSINLPLADKTAPGNPALINGDSTDAVDGYPEFGQDTQAEKAR